MQSIVFIAAILLLIASLEKRDQRRKKKILTETGNAQSANHHCNSAHPEPAPNNTDRHTQQHRSTERQHWRRQNIIASMALVAATAAAIGAGLAYTEAKRQADAGWEAARQATRQADTTIGTEHNQLRAYLAPVFTHAWISCQSCNPQIGGPKEKADEMALRPDSLNYAIKNYGATPALNPVVCIHVTSVGPGESADDLANRFLSECLRPYRQTIAPINPIPNVWPSEQREEGFKGGDFIFHATRLARHVANGFVFGVILYRDIFGMVHHSFICRGITVPSAEHGGGINGCSLPDQWQDD